MTMETDCRTVKARLDAGEDFLLIDCREQQEYDTARIDGATLIPMGQIPNRLAELESHRDGLVVIHCHHGGRSLNVARWLKAQGFAQPLSMAGGIDEWSKTIDPGVPRY
ncbi:MAG: rhodanese-like domain-containing protein [Planctomycetaceae bacterium]